MFKRNDCKQVRELLSPYMDERLEGRERQTVEEHLKECETCMRELESLRSTVALLRLTPVVRPPRSFTLREPVVPQRALPSLALLRWSTALVAVLLLVLVGGDFLSSVALRGSSAPSAQMVQKAADRAESTASEATGATNKQLAPSVPATGASDQASKAAPTPSAAAGASVQPAPPASTATTDQTKSDPAKREALQATPSTLSAPSTGTGGPEGGNPQPTAAAQPRSNPSGLSLPLIKGVEIGLAGLILILVVVGWLVRRARD